MADHAVLARDGLPGRSKADDQIGLTGQSVQQRLETRQKHDDLGRAQLRAGSLDRLLSRPVEVPLQGKRASGPDLSPWPVGRKLQRRW